MLVLLCVILCCFYCENQLLQSINASFLNLALNFWIWEQMFVLFLAKHIMLTTSVKKICSLKIYIHIPLYGKIAFSMVHLMLLVCNWETKSNNWWERREARHCSGLHALVDMIVLKWWIFWNNLRICDKTKQKNACHVLHKKTTPISIFKLIFMVHTVSAVLMALKN